MAFVIKAWCYFCLISAFTSVSLLLTSTVILNNTSTDSPVFSKWIFQTLIHRIYKYLLKPLLFLFDPEKIHHALIDFGKFLASNSITRILTSACFSFSHSTLTKKIHRIEFPNVVGLAAGYDYTADMIDVSPHVGFGFQTVGTVTLESYEGNPPPRLDRFPKSKSLLVNKGFKSEGAKSVIAKLENKKFAIPIGISIGSTNKIFSQLQEQVDDVVGCFKLFERSKVKHSYYELNISCPNTKGGQPFAESKNLKKLISAVSKLKIERPVFVKMPIDLGQKTTQDLLQVIDASPIQGIIFGNLTKDKNNPAVHPEDATLWKNKKGNLSGKPTWERSNALLGMTKKLYKNRFTLIGTGGIFSPEDAEEKIKLGADLVQLITGMIYEGPQLIGQINNYLARKKLSS